MTLYNILPEYILGRCNEAAQVTGFKNPGKKKKACVLLWLFLWMVIRTFWSLASSFSNYIPVSQTLFLSFLVQESICSNNQKNSGLTIKFSTEGKGTYFKVFFNNLIALILVFTHITHKIYKHKVFIQFCVCSFFCQFSHHSQQCFATDKLVVVWILSFSTEDGKKMKALNNSSIYAFFVENSSWQRSLPH